MQFSSWFKTLKSRRAPRSVLKKALPAKLMQSAIFTHSIFASFSPSSNVLQRIFSPHPENKQ